MRHSILRGILIFPLLALCAGWGRLAAQHSEFQNFDRIRSVGPLPADMHATQDARFQRRLSTIGIPTDDSDQELARAFVRDISHAQDQIMLGGKIYYGDPVTTYLNRLKDYILRDDPELRTKINVYLYRLSRSNAFAVGTDAIIVTTGMMASVTNEASLAFTLCHEISHLKYQHAKNRYKVIKDEKRKANEDMFDWMRVRNIYNRAQEFEADREGFLLFRKTDFGCRDVYTAFDDMAYPNEFHNRHILFDKSFFETPDQRFDKLYVLNPVDSIIVNEYEDDSDESHPNVRKRRSAIAQLDEAQGCEQSNPFVVSEKEFRHAQELARFEQVNAYMHDARHVSAIFQAYLLLKVHPGNLFLRKAIATSLHNIFTLRSKSESILDGITILEEAGEFQRADHFFSNLDLLSLGLLSVRWAFDTWQDAPHDQHLKAIWQHDMRELVLLKPATTKDLLRIPAPDSLFARCNIPLDSLWAIGPDEERTRISRMNPLEAYFLTEGETVTNDEGEDEEIPGDSLWLKRRLHAWAVPLSNPTFDSTFRALLALSDTATREGLRRLERKLGQEQPAYSGPVIVLSPTITHLKYKKGERVTDHSALATIDSAWHASLKMSAAQKALPIHVMDLEGIAATDTIVFSDFHAIRNFDRDEAHDSYNLKLSRHWQQVMEVCERQGSTIVVVPSLWYAKRRQKLDALDYVLLVVAAPIYGPILLAKAIFPEQRTELMYSWYDLRGEGTSHSNNFFGRGKLSARALRNFADSAVQDLAPNASSD